MAQAKTKLSSIASIVGSAAFSEGFLDAKDPFGKEDFPNFYETMDKKEQWDYERGRLFGIIFPEISKLKRGKKVMKEVINSYSFASEKRWII